MLKNIVSSLLSPKILLVMLTLLVAYGQTLQMYFWQDDSALIFKLQNPGPEAGSFGAGVIGNGPYKYLVTPFVPFFPLFGKEPFWYFLVGFILLLPATYAFYLFADQLFKNNKAAYFATLIFASGYVGSEIMFRIINSWQSNLGLTLTLLSFYFFTKYLNINKLRYWLLALIFYWAATEFVYVRSHSLIFVIFGIDLLYNLLPFKLTKFIKITFRQIPFLLLFYERYIGGGTSGSSSIGNYLSRILSGQYELLIAVFANFANGLVNTPLQLKLLSISPNHYMPVITLILLLATIFLGTHLRLSIKRSIFVSLIALLISKFIQNKFLILNLFWYQSPRELLPGYIGIYLFIVVFLFSINLLKKQDIGYKFLTVGSLIVVTQIFSYAIQFNYPPAIFDTAHRYFNYSMIGFSIFYGGICFYVYTNHKNKLLKYVPLFFIIVTNLYLSATYQRDLVLERSIPSREFYKQLLSDTGKVQKSSVFYFDVESKHQYQQEFRNFFSVGSMPEETALAIYYNLDRYDFKIVNEYNELLAFITQNDIPLEKVYVFAYGQNGLIDKSEDFRKNALSGSDWVMLKPENNQIVLNSPILSLPILLNIKVNKNISPDITFPFNVNSEIGYNKEEKQQILAYFEQRSQYYENVVLSSESEWRYQEIENAADNNNQTSWRGHRIYWNDNEHESVTITLPHQELLAKVAWVNWQNSLSPIDYSWAASINGEEWVDVGKVTNGPVRGNGELVIDDIENVQAKYLRLSITKTATNDAPAISEIEIIPADYENLDIKMATKFIDNPYVNTESRKTLDSVDSDFMRYSYFNLTAIANTGDKREFYLPFNSLGGENYQVVIWPKDSTISKVDLAVDSKYPFDISVVEAKYKQMSLTEIKKMGLIKQFSEN